MKELLGLLSEDNAEEIIKVLIQEYKPAASVVVKELFNIYKDFSNNTEFPETVARVKKNQFLAYLGAGFTREEALVLLVNDANVFKEGFNRSLNNTNKK